MKHLVLCVSLLALVACEPTGTAPTEPAPTAAANPAARVSTRTAANNFNVVVRAVEPVAERECRSRAPDLNCDFKIVIDNDPRKPPNAFQTLDRSGRPVLGFTVALIATARNRDELAFVMGHEAAHHIERHLIKQRQTSAAGSIVGALGDAVLGTSILSDVGGFVGARAYSKQNELEADALGTVISKRAGFDPVRGAQFFTRIPDPGDRFLGTHPPNASRIDTVRRVNSQI